MFNRHILIAEYLKFLLGRQYRIIKRLAPISLAARNLGSAIYYLLYSICEIGEVYFHLLDHLGNKPVLLFEQCK